jgi:hypothetical protein
LHDKDVWDLDDVRQRMAHFERQHKGGTWWVYDDVRLETVHICPDTAASMSETNLTLAAYYRYDAIDDSHKRVSRDWLPPRVGELKKPHYHVICRFDYSLTMADALGKLDLAGISLAYIERVNSEDSYIRYLCHLDNPEKYQYSMTDVVSVGGYDSSALWALSSGDKLELDGRLWSLAKDCSTFADLASSVQKQDDWQLWFHLKGSQSFWNNFIRSRVRS